MTLPLLPFFVASKPSATLFSVLPTELVESCLLLRFFWLARLARGPPVGPPACSRSTAALLPGGSDAGCSAGPAKSQRLSIERLRDSVEPLREPRLSEFSAGDAGAAVDPRRELSKNEPSSETACIGPDLDVSAAPWCRALGFLPRLSLSDNVDPLKPRGRERSVRTQLLLAEVVSGGGGAGAGASSAPLKTHGGSASDMETRHAPRGESPIAPPPPSPPSSSKKPLSSRTDLRLLRSWLRSWLRCSVGEAPPRLACRCSHSRCCSCGALPVPPSSESTEDARRQMPAPHGDTSMPWDVFVRPSVGRTGSVSAFSSPLDRSETTSLSRTYATLSSSARDARDARSGLKTSKKLPSSLVEVTPWGARPLDADSRAASFPEPGLWPEPMPMPTLERRRTGFGQPLRCGDSLSARSRSPLPRVSFGPSLEAVRVPSFDVLR